ncbi:MAG TPA: CpsD/CapB family tyrosine-protein kinase [Acidobacteriaceae bacterium]|jgi:capsular exopolysaccharide synthesis family protein|nr:CpsD/CapB family tyrosine-protein kinase [Acidobacteriaceae bacterium]
MSRIYEALQRAEAERQLERGENAEETQPRIAENVHAAVSGRFAAPPAPVSAIAAATSTALAEPPAQEQRALQTAFPREIEERPWQLSIDRLPALEHRGPAVEQFRSLRSRVQEFRAMNRLKSLLVSSGIPQEGKSFIAANLAVSLALHKNNKVLLVDGDMRRSSLQEYFGFEATAGLADYLAGTAELAAVMQRPDASSRPSQAIAPILNNLVMIPAGNGGDKAADLAGSPRFEELLQRAAPHFDWIIVDSSPVLPVSDAVSMGRACDAVLLVARSNFTSFPVAQRAKHELKASNIIGFVLNAVKNPPALNNYYTYESNTA